MESCGKKMWKQFVFTSLLLGVSFGLLINNNPKRETYKCCMPDQWGGTLFISSGSSMVPMNWTLCSNGTAMFAYDAKLEKIFIGMELVHQSPQIPQYLHVNWTMLYDFKQTYKCCMPDRWGGMLFISSGSSMVPLNWTIYTNGTAVFAYDAKLEKIFLGMEVNDQSPQMPHILHVNWTMLYDFKKGILYDVESGDCDKSSLEKDAIQRMSCIPATAELLSRATLGDNEQAIVTTYRFKYPDNTTDVTVTATVKEEGSVINKGESPVCVPVIVTYSSSVSTLGGLMYSFDVFDIGPINSTDIFNIPKPCL